MEEEFDYCTSVLLHFLRRDGPLSAGTLHRLSGFTYDQVHSSLRLLTNLDVACRVVPPGKFIPVYATGLLDRLALEVADADAEVQGR